jgi:two-component system KDP operon response regulator KdpE
MTKILVVDDDPQLLRTLHITLRGHGYEITTAVDGRTALSVTAAEHPDLVMLDLGLPDIDGVDVIRKLRTWTTVPIVILSGRLESSSKVHALDAGANDYVTKPFSVDELLARVRAATRRYTSAAETPPTRIGEYVVDLRDRRIALASDPTQNLHLTPTEWQVLEILVRNAGRLVTQQAILEQVWGPTFIQEGGYVRQYIKYLRRKLEINPSRPEHLLTEPGLGYRYEP